MSTEFRTKYKILCKIGEGSFSDVLKCQEHLTGQWVAAKQLKKSFESLDQVDNLPELIALAKIAKHENVLTMKEYFFDQPTGIVTIIFELMDMSMCDLLKNRRRPVPEGKAKSYLFQIAKGVEHIHSHGIFHRDIKPENILHKGELVKISDLGSIKGSYSRHPYTAYISTRWYRSPECLLTNGFYGPKMDIWAMGCVFYELLTLKPLFPGSSEIDQISKINSVLGNPSQRLLAKFKRHKSRNITVYFPTKHGSGLMSLIPCISEGARDILKQMLVYDPDARTNIRRLCEHKYFNDIRLNSELSQPINITQAYSMTAGILRGRQSARILDKKSRLAPFRDENLNENKLLYNKGDVLDKSRVIESIDRIRINNTQSLGTMILNRKNNDIRLVPRDKTYEKSIDPSQLTKKKYRQLNSLNEIENESSLKATTSNQKAGFAEAGDGYHTRILPPVKIPNRNNVSGVHSDMKQMSKLMVLPELKNRRPSKVNLSKTKSFQKPLGNKSSHLSTIK